MILTSPSERIRGFTKCTTFCRSLYLVSVLTEPGNWLTKLWGQWESAKLKSRSNTMKRKTVSVLFMAFVVFLVCFGGCGDTISEIPAGTTGWYLQSLFLDSVAMTFDFQPYVTLSGTLVSSLTGFQGVVSPFTGQSNDRGVLVVLRGAPAIWTITWVSVSVPSFSQGCDGKSIAITAIPNKITYIECWRQQGNLVVAVAPLAFSFNPNPVYSYAPPSSATATGSGFKYTYGMPM